MCVFGHEQLKDAVNNDKAFADVIVPDAEMCELRGRSHAIGLEYGDASVNKNVSRKIIANVEHPRRMER